MKTITLSILRRELNPNYKPRRDNYGTSEPQYLETQSMIVEITEEQFEAIRKEVLKNF